MLCARNSGEWPSEAMTLTEGGVWKSTPEDFQKTRLQMVQSELFWSFICEFFCFYIFFFFLNFFLESGATPVFPEQLAAMQQTLSK